MGDDGPWKRRHLPDGMTLLSRSSHLSVQLLFGACLLAARHGVGCAGDTGEMMSTAGLQGTAGGGRGVLPLGTSSTGRSMMAAAFVRL